MDVIELTGFHGTSKSAAQSILAEGFKPSEKISEWLGNGIYFFQNLGAANYWAKKECQNDPVILQADIRIFDHEWLDMNSPADEEKYQKFVEQQLNDIKRLGKPLPVFTNAKGQYDAARERCFWCNLYVIYHGTKMISYKFRDISSPEVTYGFRKYYSNIQMCVFDSSIIVDIKEVSSDAI